MKQFKNINLFFVVIFLFSLLTTIFFHPVKAENRNPLKIEKVIGLSKIPGTFRNSHGLAVAKDGTIFIADKGESQVEVYDTNLKYLSSFGSIGSGNGQFQDLDKIAFDEDGNLFTLDAFLCRIQVFTKEGKFIRSFGEKGEKPEQLSSPEDFAFLKTGELLVIDYEKSIKVFSKEGKYKRFFFKEEKFWSKDWIFFGMVIDNQGYVYISAYNSIIENSYYLKFTQDGIQVCEFIKNGSEEKDITFGAYCIALEDTYFYIFDGNDLKKFKIPEVFTKPLEFIETLIKKSNNPPINSTILYPSSIQCLQKKIYLLDYSLNRMVILAESKEILGIIQSSIMEYGNKYLKNEILKGTLSQPRGITIGPDNYFYVINSGYKKITVFDENWIEINSFGRSISGNKKQMGELNFPVDIAFDKQDFCYVSDIKSNDNTIEIFDTNFEPYESISFQSISPSGLATNSVGNLVVCKDGYTETAIELFDISDIKEKKIVKKKTIPVDGIDLIDLVIDDEDNMIVSLMYSNEIQWINTNGNMIQKIGIRQKNNNDESIIKSPRGLFRDGGGNIYVSEPYEKKIKKFSPDGNQIWESDLDYYGLSYFTMDSQGKLYVTDVFHNIILVLHDETAIPPVPIEPIPLHTNADFSFSINKEILTKDDLFITYLNAKHLIKCASITLSIRFPQDLISYQSYQLNQLLIYSHFQVIDSTIDSGLLTLVLESSEGVEINNFGVLIMLQFAANEVGSGKIAFEKIEIKNSIEREVLFKTKTDLDFIVYKKDITPPKLKVFSYPDVTYDSSITILGETEPGAIIMVNKKQFPVNSDGKFSISIELVKGVNNIKVTAIDKAGNESVLLITINYKDRTIIKLVVGSKVIIINGASKTLDTEPFIDKNTGRTLLSFQASEEALGALVSYDPLTRKINITKGETLIQLWIGKTKAIVNGKDVNIDPQKPVSPLIVNGRILLPLRFIAETFEFKVDWYSKAQVITMTYPDPGKK